MNITIDLSDINRNDNSFGLSGATTNSLKELSLVDNGGKGSGNFGHGGRPGKVGGSSSHGSSSSSKKSDKSFHSRYEDKESFEYDGDTFYVDESKRGGTTKDGKRTMMFPDEILHSREQIIDSYEKSKSMSDSQYSMALGLSMKLMADQERLADKADIKKAKELYDRLAKILQDQQLRDERGNY